MTAGLWNPSRNDFSELAAADREILDRILTRWDPAELPEPAALEPFDAWLGRVAASKKCVVIAPEERNARVLHAARRAELDNIPVIRRVAESDAAPTARPRTTVEYLEQRGETRKSAEARIRERLGPPGQARTVEETGRRKLVGNVIPD